MKIRKVTDKLLHLTFDKASEAQELVTCEKCGLSFHATNTTEEAKADFERDFPGHAFSPENVALICEDCYQSLEVDPSTCSAGG